MSMALYLISRARSDNADRMRGIARYVRSEYNDPNPLWIGAKETNYRVREEKISEVLIENRKPEPIPSLALNLSIDECCQDLRTRASASRVMPELGTWSGSPDKQ